MELTVRSVEKSFGETHALKGVSFTARSGSPMGLLGRNGAGKTTAMRIIMNVFKADSGEVLVDGVPIERSGARLGYLPEERGLYRKMNVGEQLVYFARLRGMGKAEAKKAVKFWLEKMDMSEYYGKKVEALSKGNQQRVQLALTLVNDPDIIILDEPFSGLDPVNALQLRDIVSQVAAQGKLIIFSSHQMNAVENFCDDIVIINHGEIVLDGMLSDIRAQAPKDRLHICGEGAESIAASFGSVQSAKEGFVLTMTDEKRRSELLAALVGGGVDVRRFEIIEPTLEEIFVSAVGQDTAQKGGKA